MLPLHGNQNWHEMERDFDYTYPGSAETMADFIYINAPIPKWAYDIPFPRKFAEKVQRILMAKGPLTVSMIKCLASAPFELKNLDLTTSNYYYCDIERLKNFPFESMIIPLSNIHPSHRNKQEIWRMLHGMSCQTVKELTLIEDQFRNRFDLFQDLISRFPNLTKLVLLNFYLDKANFDAICSHSSIVHLNLSGCQLECILPIGEMTQLEYLILNGTHLSSCRHILQLQKLANLVHLDFTSENEDFLDSLYKMSEMTVRCKIPSDWKKLKCVGFGKVPSEREYQIQTICAANPSINKIQLFENKCTTFPPNIKILDCSSGENMSKLLKYCCKFEKPVNMVVDVLEDIKLSWSPEMFTHIDDKRIVITINSLVIKFPKAYWLLNESVLILDRIMRRLDASDSMIHLILLSLLQIFSKHEWSRELIWTFFQSYPTIRMRKTRYRLFYFALTQFMQTSTFSNLTCLQVMLKQWPTVPSKALRKPLRRLFRKLHSLFLAEPDYFPENNQYNSDFVIAVIVKFMNCSTENCEFFFKRGILHSTVDALLHHSQELQWDYMQILFILIDHIDHDILRRQSVCAELKGWLMYEERCHAQKLVAEQCKAVREVLF